MREIVLSFKDKYILSLCGIPVAMGWGILLNGDKQLGNEASCPFPGQLYVKVTLCQMIPVTARQDFGKSIDPGSAHMECHPVLPAKV